MAYRRSALTYTLQASTACFLVLLAASTTAAAEDLSKPDAASLLRSVESARSINGPVRIEALVQQFAPPPVVDLHYVLDVDGDRKMSNLLRVEQGKRRIDDGEIALIDGEDVQFHSRSPHSDVAVSDLDTRTAPRGGFLFDPTILGLSDVHSLQTTVKGCLKSDRAENAEVLRQEELNGVKVWHIRLRPEPYVYEFWIEEPAFRVHRKVVTWPGTRIQIDLQYDADNKLPFPSSYQSKRTVDGQVTLERRVTIKNFKIGAKFEPDHFTLKGMKVPLNTPVVDYIIGRRMGYWDGEGLSEWPVDLKKVER